MGRRGPAPKPRALKLVEGTLRPDRDPPRSVEPPVEAPECPSWLGREAKREWKRIVPELERLGLIAEIDRAALAAYCQSWHRWWEAERVIEEHGQTFVTPTGFIRERPEVAIAASEKRALRLFVAEFGLTPAARTRLPSDRVAGEGPRNPFEALR